MSENKKKISFGTVCCVPGCKNNTKHNRNVSWHGFPSDLRTRKEWIRRVNRVGTSGKYSKWCPTKSHKICGAHFNASGKKKYEEKLPSLFPHKTYDSKYFTDTALKLTVMAEPSFNPNVYPIQYDEQSPHFTSDITTDIEVGANVVVQHIPMRPSIRNVEQLDNSSNAAFRRMNPVDVHESSKASPSTTCHNYALHTSETLPGVKKKLNDVIAANLALEDETRRLKLEVQKLTQQLTTLGTKCRKLEADLIIKKSKLSTLTILEKKTFSLESILEDDDKIKFYTGFQSKVRLTIFLNFIVEIYNSNYRPKVRGLPKGRGRPKALDTRNELFVVLCRLRLGLLEVDLAHRFELSVGTISRIWNFWIPFICLCLEQVPIWPNRQTVDRFMPKDFKEMYPTTRIILDCTELFIENPTEFRVQSDTYSSYKSHNTAKGLIGITPNGFVSLVSDLAPGRVSDKVITSESGLYAKLEPGDSVMADRGFLIEDSLREIGVGLNIPPFLKGNPQLSPEDEKLTRDIAKLRIHVERVIREVKQFRILKYVFPNSMADKLEPIWKICCLLINFINKPLLDRVD